MEFNSDEYMAYAIRLLVAALVGGLVGIEREIKGKPAGMRTNILMCLGSCVLMILSIETARQSTSPADPGRIAAQVVTGVGFLCAGVILRSRVNITGLTSAATVWFVAAIGLVIGFGDFVVAGMAVVLVLTTLTLLDGLEKRFEVRKQIHILKLLVQPDHVGDVRKLLLVARIQPDDVEVDLHDDLVRMHIEYVAHNHKRKALLKGLHENEGIDILVDY